MGLVMKGFATIGIVCPSVNFLKFIDVGCEIIEGFRPQEKNPL